MASLRSLIRLRTIFAVLSISSLVALGATNVANASPKLAGSYYISLGDSYAEGYQPGYTDNSETLSGYANQVVSESLAHNKKLLLENFGCGGATTNSILNTVGCPAPAKNAPLYPNTTQAQAALNFIAKHKKLIGLITISIGGNDFDGCALSPISCVQAAMPQMESNILKLAAKLRSAVGWKVPIIAITYPDVIAADWLTGTSGQAQAQLSEQAFSTIINPTLEAAYAPAKIRFIDVTTATGSETPFGVTTTLAPYGTVPVAVAQVCTLTWICAKGDIHPQPAGYTLISKLITAQYFKLLR
jgi:lysophospholipase L1-like esterase